MYIPNEQNSYVMVLIGLKLVVFKKGNIFLTLPFLLVFVGLLPYLIIEMAYVLTNEDPMSSRFLVC